MVQYTGVPVFAKTPQQEFVKLVCGDLKIRARKQKEGWVPVWFPFETTQKGCAPQNVSHPYTQAVVPVAHGPSGTAADFTTELGNAAPLET